MCYLLNWINFLFKNQNIKKTLEKGEKLEKSGNVVSPQKCEPCDGQCEGTKQNNNQQYNEIKVDLN